MTTIPEKFKKLYRPKADVNRYLEKAFSTGDYDTAIHILTTPKLQINLPNIIDYNYVLTACFKGHSDFLKQLMSIDNIKAHINIFTIPKMLPQACISNNQELISFLINDLNTSLESQRIVNECLLSACLSNNLDLMKFFLHCPTLPVKAQARYSNSFALAYACNRNYLDMVQYLLTSEELKEKPEINNPYHFSLLQCNRPNNKKMLDFLLTSETLKEKADIHAHDDKAFIDCLRHSNPNKNYIKYLLMSKKLKQHININTQNSRAFEILCLNGQYSLAKYLLTSKELKEHLNPYPTISNVLGYLCRFSTYHQHGESSQMDMIRFLIYDYKLEYNGVVKAALKEFPFYDNLFIQRDLKKTLENNLDVKNHTKRNKI